jgi:hypothetical protein
MKSPDPLIPRSARELAPTSSQDPSPILKSAQMVSQAVVLGQTHNDVTCLLVIMASPERQFDIGEPPYDPESKGEVSTPSLAMRHVEPSPPLTDRLRQDQAAPPLWTSYIKIEGIPEGTTWAEFVYASGFALLLGQNTSALRMLQTGRGDASTIWLQMASDTDALLAQGFLANRMYLNNLTLECSFITVDEFMRACLVATCMERLGGVLRGEKANPAHDR